MQKGNSITNSDDSRINKAVESINTVFSFENLYHSFEKCTLGVKWKYSTQNYMLNACCRIARLRKRILNGTYKMSRVREFTICERGKERKISALTFEDRIVNKCLCDYFLNPLLQRSLIYDNGATLKGKGLSFTKRRLKVHLSKYYHHFRNKGYILKIDLHSYFESINHDILKAMLRKKIKNDHLYEFTASMIPDELKGLGLGSQVSQICAIFYMNEIDHFIKEKLRYKYYGRYNDDLYIISDSKVGLESALKKIRQKIERLKLIINEKKTKIYELSQGFVFCKTRYFIKDTGRILTLPTGHTIARFMRKCRTGVEMEEIKHSLVSYLKSFNAYKILGIVNKNICVLE